MNKTAAGIQKAGLLARAKKALKRMTAEDCVIAAINYAFLLFIGIICLVPFLYLLSMSFTAEEQLSTIGVKLIPRIWSLDAYNFIFSRGQVIARAYGVSVLVTVSGVLLSVMLTAGMAYPLARQKLPFRNALLGYILFTMLFGGGLIPIYLVVKNWLGLKDSYLALIVPGAFSAWNMILMKNFFASLPPELEEAAVIDGANELRLFFVIILPLSKPILATIALFMMVGYWNDWFSSLLYISDSARYPIMRVLKDVLGSLSGSSVSPGQGLIPPSESIGMAIVVIVVLPIVCVYPFMQKHFAKGMLVGSVKG
jgi:putative aldouronate transport system permease protein